MPVLFTTGDQATVDAWYKRVRRPFGQIEFTAAPVAVPPTLTIFVGNPAVKLRELKIPKEVEVIHGNVPGTFHVWNDKEADKAAAQTPVSPAEMKLVTEINVYIEQRAPRQVPVADLAIGGCQNQMPSHVRRPHRAAARGPRK